MTLPKLEPTRVGSSLSKRVNGFGPDEEWVQFTLHLFQVPSILEAPQLFYSLRRVAREISWAGLPEPNESLMGRLERVIERIDGLPKGSRKVAAHQMSGKEFGLAGAMVGADEEPARGTEALRAALWTCHANWFAEGRPRWTAVRDLASSIRSIVLVRGPKEMDAHPVVRHVTKLGGAADLPGFIDRAAVLKGCGQASIEDAWSNHVEGTLMSLARMPRPEPIPIPPPVVAGPSGGGQKKSRKKVFDEDDAIDAIVRPIRRVSARVAGPEGEPTEGEPAGEVSTSEFVCPVGASTNPDAGRLSVYQARQAIWGQNRFLLTNHPDVLPAGELREVMGLILADLQAAPADQDLHLGLVCLLLQGITGRTSKTLRSIQVVERHSSELEAGRFELCPARGTFQLGVFWKEEKKPDKPLGYFLPTPEQIPLLEPVGESFLLPLGSGIAEALRRQRDLLDRLSRTTADGLDGRLRAAARHVSSRLGLRLSAGQVRRSFSAHLYEHCRDSALTQLICMDSLGQSTNSLHYYAPTRSTLANAYWKTLRSLVPSDEAMPAIEDPDLRVGCHLLLNEDTVRAMASAPSTPLQAGVSQLIKEGHAWLVHQAIVNHLACMLLALAGHRAVDALFRITVGGADADAGLGLFLDKIFDPAHNPRLVAFPRCLRDQLTQYLAHLRGLASVLPALAGHVRRVLQGREPLLFHVSSESQVVALTMESWKPTLPEIWRTLPLHWGRSWIRTRGTEAGLPPEWASIQLGHLEAVDYPFSNGSPTEPLAFVEAAGPFLEKVARQQGWKVRKGLPCADEQVGLPLTPLRSWASTIAKHEQAIRDRQKASRLEQLSRMKHYRKRATEDVLQHPAIVEAGIAAAFQSEAQPMRLLSKQEAEALRDELYEQADDDVALGLARSVALHRILKAVNKRAGVKKQEPARLIGMRRQVDNAFFPEMLRAYRQVQGLREWMVQRGEDTPDDWRDFPRACARAALAIALFGFCEEPDRILGVLKHRSQCVRSAVLDDTLLAPWRDDAADPVALRDLAAFALGKLAKKYKINEMPSREEINGALAVMLPEWALPKRGKGDSIGSSVKTVDLLDLICETVGVCNRIELSPAARLVMHPEQGSVGAHMREQLALIDADPPGSLVRDWEAPVDPGPAREKARTPPPSKSSARTQYLSLCAVLPHKGKDLALPLTAVNVPASDLFAPATRPKVIAEVSATLAQEAPARCLQPIVRMLARWTLEMLEEGTQAKVDPADITISTYLTRIGAALVEALGNSSMVDVDGAELEDAYLTAIKVENKSCDDAASAILSFHDCCVRRFGLPELDLCEVRAFLRSDQRSVDAHLILPVERQAAVSSLIERARQAEGVDADSRRQGRLMRQAGAAIPLYAFGGARRSEVLGTRFADFSVRSGIPRMRVRANHSRRLKTRAARRIVEVAHGLPAGVTEHITRWLETDRRRLQESRSEHAFVFSPLNAPRSADGRGEIAATCQKFLAAATGRPTERLHRLRHLVAFDRTTPHFLSREDACRMSGVALGNVNGHACQHVALPRDLMAEVITMGHTHWRTTLTCYHHLPWLLLSRPQARISDRYLHRRTVASVLGVALPRVDEITQKDRSTPRAQAWMDSVKPVRTLPQPVRRTSSPVSAVQRKWTAQELDVLLNHVDRMGTLDRALEALGGNPDDAARIRLAAKPFEQRFGRRLIGGGADPSPGHPKRLARKTRGAEPLSELCKSFDGSNEKMVAEISQIVRSVYDWMQPKDADRIRLPAATAARLVSVLHGFGVSHDCIERGDLGEGLETIRIQRERKASPARESGQSADQFLGIALKRVLGMVWLSLRLSEGDSASTTPVRASASKGPNHSAADLPDGRDGQDSNFRDS
ncbi:MAG: hypothetical protein JSS45_10710 [Proteobacteria bacterium]|nr:hypothetical protein [Pseudomonadota bacterium]